MLLTKLRPNLMVLWAKLSRVDLRQKRINTLDVNAAPLESQLLWTFDINSKAPCILVSNITVVVILLVQLP